MEHGPSSFGGGGAGDAAVGGLAPGKKPREARPPVDNRDAKYVTLPEDNFMAPRVVDSTYGETETLSIPPSGDPDGPILTFNVDKRFDGHNLFLNEMKLALTLALVDKDGRPPPRNEKRVSVVQGYPQALWKSAKLYLNQTEVSAGDAGAHALRAHVHFLLNSTSSGKLKKHSFGWVPFRGHSYDKVGHPAAQLVQGQLCQLAIAPPSKDRERNAPLSRELRDALKAEVAALGAAVAAGGGGGNGADPLPVTAELLDRVARVDLNRPEEEGGVVRVWDPDEKLVYAHICTDFGLCKLPLISGCGVQLVLTRNPPPFYMMVMDDSLFDKGYRLRIKSAALLLPMRRFSPDLALDLERTMSRAGGYLNYDFKRVEVKRFTIPSGQKSWSCEDLKSGHRVPERVVLMMVEEDAFDGQAWSKNPLASDAVRVDSLWAVDDIRFTLDSFPVEPMGVASGAHRSPRNFLAKAYAQLQSVFSNEESFGLDLSYAEFVKGGFLYAVDLTRPRRAHNSVAWHKVRQGSLRLDVSFADHIAANVSVFAMLEYPTRVQIFKDR